MPNFAAYLKKLNANNELVDDIALDSTGNNLIATEHSNYILSDEDGNLEANFDLFRKLSVEDPNGDTYLFSSIGDGNVSIDPGNSGSNIFTYPRPSLIDGKYKFRLITVPTWNDSSVYDIDTKDYVARTVTGTTNIYKLIADTSTNEAPEDNTDVWELVTDLTTINVKYNVVGYAFVTLNLWKCMKKNAIVAATKMTGQNFGDLREIPEWVVSQSIQESLKSVSYLVSQGMYDQAATLIGDATKLCNC